jgi:hypothetical protein
MESFFMSILSTQGNVCEANPAITHREPIVKTNPRWTYAYLHIVSIIQWCHDPKKYSAAMNVLEVLGIEPKKRGAIFRRVVARGHSAAFSRNELDRRTARLWYQFLALALSDDDWVDECLEASKWYRECLSNSRIPFDLISQIENIALRFNSREAFLKANWDSIKVSEDMLKQVIQNA